MKLWAHQLAASEFIRSRRHAIVYAGMGTGKTGAAIHAIVGSGVQRAIVVCPPRVILAWEAQLEQWGFPLPVIALKQDSTAARVKALTEAPKTGLVLTNYQGFWRDDLYNALRRWKAEMVIYDEVHNLKSPGSRQSKRAGAWYKDFDLRVGLTGTLIANGLQDIYGQARAIRPDLYGTNYNKFLARYAVMGGYENREILSYKNTDDYHDRLNQFVMKVDNEGLIDLPDVVIQDMPVDLGKATKRAIEDLDADMLAEVEQGFITASNVLVKSTRLRQLASGIASVDGGAPLLVDTAKIDAAMAWLDSVGPHPTLVWTNYVLEGDGLYQAARTAGYKVSRVFGKHDEYAAWVAGQTDVLIISMQAGAEGLNDMVRSRHILYFSPTYSLIQYEQSFKRTHRPGADLNHKVNYTHLVARGTIEREIYRALVDKRDVAAAVFAAIRNRA